MTHDALHSWEKWPVGALFVAQGLYVAEWYIGARLPALVALVLPWVATVGGLAAMLAIDGAMIATVAGMRGGRRSRWSVGAIIVTAAFGAAVALHLHGALPDWLGAWLHAGFALTIAMYLLHLAQPRSAPPVAVAPQYVPSDVAPAQLPAPGEQAAEPLTLDDVLDALDTRTQVVKWRDDEGLSFVEIGKRLNVTRQGAQDRYKREKQAA